MVLSAGVEDSTTSGPKGETDKVRLTDEPLRNSVPAPLVNEICRGAAGAQYGAQIKWGIPLE